MCLAVPGKVLSIDGDDFLRSGRVSFNGITKAVNLSCVPEAQIGSYVLVHVGLAISIIDEVEAQRVFEYLTIIDDLGELAGKEAVI